MLPTRENHVEPARSGWMGKCRRLARLAFPILMLALSGCQTDPVPEPETVLWLKLNDSLNRYETVLVQIVDRNNQDNVLATLWNKPLPSPGTDIQPFRLSALADDDFIVKIMGYIAQGQLALHTQITYDGGKKSVLHKEVPPLIPRDKLSKLTPSLGTLTPAFSADVFAYTLNVAKDASVSFSLATENPAATLDFDGEPVAAGTPTKSIAVTSDPDTLLVRVTDPSTGTPATRTYTVKIVPISPPGLYLGSLVPSAGTLLPEFKPTVQVYSLMLPLGIDTVAFTVTPADARTMTMSVSGKALLPGQRSQTFKIEAGSSFPIPFEVYRGAELGYYQVTVELFNP